MPIHHGHHHHHHGPAHHHGIHHGIHHHGIGHHHGISHHHGIGHHQGIHHSGIGHHHGIGLHHGIGHHHHRRNIHHHAPVSGTGRAVGGPIRAINLGMFGLFFLTAGIIMMGVGFSSSIGLGIVGCLLFAGGLALMITCGVLCRKIHKQQQQTVVDQEAAGVTTMEYSQPDATPIVEPQQPGAPPIIHPQGPGATIVYGPGGQVAYQPQAQPGFQPEPQQYPATIPYPQPVPDMSKSDLQAEPIAPPPTYEDAVNPASKPDSASDTPIAM